MKLINYLLLTIFLVGTQGCQGSMKNRIVNRQSARMDTILIESEMVAIFIIPTNDELSQLKSNSEDVFYTLSDDAAYYSVKAEKYLQTKGVNIVNIDTTCLVLDFFNSYYFNLSDTTKIHNPLFDIILYKKGCLPLVTSSVDIENDACEYFGLENIIEDIHDVLPVGNGKGAKDSKWLGVYQMDIGYDKHDGNAFTVTLNIDNDSVIYEAEGHMLSNLYQLSVVEEQENYIKLAYYKQIDEQYSLYALGKTTDFGILEIHDGKYIWKDMKYLTVITGEDVEYTVNKK